MDPNVFAAKRMHLRVVHFGRKILEPYGLTPARFDMLYAIEKNRNRCIMQRDLPPLLGLSRSTVSKMLKLLEELGLIVRTKTRKSGEMKLVVITQDGLDRLHAAIGGVVCNGEVAERFATVLGGHRVDYETLPDVMFTIAKTVGDVSTFRYPAFDPWGIGRNGDLTNSSEDIHMLVRRSALIPSKTRLWTVAPARRRTLMPPPGMWFKADTA
jgi:DNA-binding MarR family transcriptional regulator